MPFWDADHNCFVMVLFLNGNNYAFFRSDNLIDWTQTSVYTMPDEWECPDFYKIKVEGTNEYKWALSGVHGKYQIGSWDGTFFTPETDVKDQDFGEMSYVQHIWHNAPNDRKVQISNTGIPYYKQVPFNNQMTFPREIKLVKKGNDYVLCGVPVEEINALHGEEHRFTSLPVSTTLTTPAYHVKAQFAITGAPGTITMRFNENAVQYNIGTKQFTITNNGNAVYEAQIEPVNNTLTFEMLSDIGFVEVFLNNGEVTGAFYQQYGNLFTTDVSASITGENAILNEFKIYEMNAIW
jgi:fructan beta-fructosidase